MSNDPARKRTLRLATGWRTPDHGAARTPLEQPRTRGAESRDLSASQRSQHETLANVDILGDLAQDATQCPHVRPAPAHPQDAERAHNRMGESDHRRQHHGRRPTARNDQAGVPDDPRESGAPPSKRPDSHARSGHFRGGSRAGAGGGFVPFLLEFGQLVGAGPSMGDRSVATEAIILPTRNEVENVAPLLARNRPRAPGLFDRGRPSSTRATTAQRRRPAFGR